MLMTFNKSAERVRDLVRRAVATIRTAWLTWIGTVAIVLVGAVVFVLLDVFARYIAEITPQQLMPVASITEDELARRTLENEGVRINLSIAAGIGGLIALVFVAVRSLAAQKQAAASYKQAVVAEEGQITERFTRAIDQLGATENDGKPKVEIRLGAIYALERIARDSERDHWPVMEVLTAYVRQHATAENLEAMEGAETTTGDLPRSKRSPRIDIKAILTVLGRRNCSYDGQDVDGNKNTLNLSQACIEGAAMHGTHLEHAYLKEVHMEEARLYQAHLNHADLRAARMDRANLIEAILDDAKLQGACLKGASLRKASLQESVLENADLDEANLDEANLNGSKLFGASLKGAIVKDAQLEGADLMMADLEDARLRNANLKDACLLGANFAGANLVGANLEGADLSGADLIKSIKLTQDQLDSAVGDQQTTLPKGVSVPAHWAVKPNAK